MTVTVKLYQKPYYYDSPVPVSIGELVVVSVQSGLKVVPVIDIPKDTSSFTGTIKPIYGIVNKVQSNVNELR